MSVFDGLPKNHFGAILADPPWAFKCWDARKKHVVASRAGATPYQTMDMNNIASLPVADLAARDCVLFMWYVWPTLPEALEIMKAWGFKYKTCGFSWIKAHAGQLELYSDDLDTQWGLGYWTRANSEACLLGTRGKPHRKDDGVRQAIIEPRRQHSRKPDCVHERIERLVAGPYLELFARAERPGWTSWGAEVGKFPPNIARSA